MKMKDDYPFIVVPLNEEEEAKAKAKDHAPGSSSTFCRDMETAQKVMARLNTDSGIRWRIKETEDEELAPLPPWPKDWPRC